MAENTATGTRTVARISDPDGPRMVTTFVRTPADTVMLAHTNGYLTINKATPAAETIGMFSPAETRDATGKLVPSSYVVKQLAPQLYVLAEVIDPQPHTTWPVYVDPPLHLTGVGGVPLPQGFSFSFKGITDTLGSGVDALSSAASTAAHATVSAAKTVGRVVKDHPLESAMLVGGVAMAVTGVGGPAGAAMIASAGVNIASSTADFATALAPDNQALGVVSDVLGAASMITPQGAAKKIVKEGTELAAEQLAKHTDDVIDVAKTTPTPRAQLVDEITATNPSPPVTPGVSPKAPNAPPHELPATALRSDLPHTGQTPSSNVKEFQPETMDPGCKLDCGYTTKSPAAVYNEVEMPGHSQHKFETVPGQLTHEFPERIPQNRRNNLRGVESKGSDGLHRDESPPASTQESRNGRSSVRHLDELESMKERKLLSALSRRYKLKGGDPQEFVYRGTDGKTRCPQCALQRYNDQQQRRASPQTQRAEQHVSTQEATNQHRNTARNTARENNQAGGQGRNSGSKALTALIENAQFCSPKVLTCVAPPMRAGLLRCWWSLTTHQLSEGDPLSHAHMGGRLGDTRPT
ncbi:hypothetical protein [Mycolicibacterium goodii]|uniref:hypothetical protein n=1 Tax=Mycolicibacterium goodii TaxID=134601 RepID=UPI00138F3B0D